MQLPSNIVKEFSYAFEACISDSDLVYENNDHDQEFIIENLSRILMSSKVSIGLDILARGGVFDHILPELNDLIGFGDAVKHKDVWLHTKKVVAQCPKRLVVRWAALFHDIGKVPTRRFLDNGQVTFIGHPEIGARMFEKICKRIPFESQAKKRIRFLIASHLRASSYTETWTDSAVRRFARESGENILDMLDLSRADITSKYEEKVDSGLNQINLLAQRIEQLRDEDAKPVPLPKGLGAFLIEALPIAPGPKLGKTMNDLKAVVESGDLPAGASFEVYLDYLKNI